ncbi:hypothetical protein ACFL7M_14675, partial [Thermodesulfobacteriota bacterium]
IDGVLFDSIPESRTCIPEEFLQHGCVTGVMEILIDIVSNEIEKSGGTQDIGGRQQTAKKPETGSWKS